jgi:hypothetical protein
MAASRDTRGRFAAKPKVELSSSYRRRIERGQRRGKTLLESRGHGVRAPARRRGVAGVEKEGYRKTLNLLHRMRRGASLYAAARAEHTTPDAVLRHAGPAVSRSPRGRYLAAPFDRLVRRMKFIDAQGVRVVEPANSREASKLAAYWSAVDHYLRTGDDGPLQLFRHKKLRVRGNIWLPFVTDPAVLDHLARAGELSFEDLYELAA